MNLLSKELKVSVKEFVANTSFSDISNLGDDTLIFREGLFDSMGFMSLITYIENNYKVTISDSDLVEENFESVNAIVNFIKNKNILV